MTQEIYVLRGLPASGKSTWAKQYIASHKNWKRVNKDDLRRMIDGGIWSKENERAILNIRDTIIKNFLIAGYSVIVDDTNFEAKHIHRIEQILRELGAENQVSVEVKTFEVDPVLNEPVAKVVRNYLETTGNEVFFFSGRSAECYEESRAWLNGHGFGTRLLWVRQSGDNRKDSHVKLDMYNRHIRGKYYVDFILDDRNQVVEMWRDTLRLPCFQVAPGDF